MSRSPIITLPALKAALGTATTSSAKVILLGTSTVQGSNATDIDRRFHQVIANKLARDYNGSKYIRYYSPQSDLTNTYTSYFTYTDGSGSHTLVSEGLSLRTVTLTNGASVAITLTASAVSILFVQGLSYGQGAVDIDGSATTWPTDARSGDHHDGVYNVTGLSNTSHTVTITAPVSGSIKFTGLVAHNYASGDPTKGIYFYNSGHGGFTTTDFVGQAYLYDRIASISPQAVVLMPGTNDYGASMSIPTYTSNLSSMITSIRSAVPSANILIITPYRRLDITGSVPWVNFQNANQAVATSYGCAYVDLTDKYPTSQALDSADLIDTDSLHQTNGGHSYMARLLYGSLT